ncbi:PDZ and LIM domain protein 7-like isoform X2 [Convolutriloba macropyga]|uniref:PDZ and LIM domain protein 7-like isoform X2 n=1 Tax=Convolutriloba macropyga TaxID=536237 RepID=UPI003F51BD85
MEGKFDICMTGSPPWGFRLAGGADFHQPITISRVTPGSLAFQHGMRDGDALLYVDGHNAASLTHLDVQNLVKQVGASGQLRLTLSRPSPHNQHRPLQRGPSYNQDQPRTSMGGPPQVQHLQYNSPIGLYSANNVYAALKDQTEGYVGNDAQVVMGRQLASALGQQGNEYDPTQSETYRLLQQDERDKHYGGSNTSSHSNLVRTYSNPREAATNDSHVQSRSVRRLQKETESNAPSSYIDKNMPPANQMERPGSNRPSYTSQQSAPMPGVKTYNRPDGSNYFNPPSQQQQQPNFSAKFSMTPSGGNQGYPSPQMSGGGSKWQPMSKPPQPNSFLPKSGSAAPPTRGTPNLNAARQNLQGAIPVLPKQQQPPAAPKPNFSMASSLPVAPEPTPANNANEWKPSPPSSDASVPSGPPLDTSSGGQDRNPTCEACKEVIRGPFVTAVGKNWHPECFKCAICGVNLQDEGFVQDDSTGQLLCEKHYNSMFAPPCYKCNQRIVGDVLHAIEKTWHSECFVCTHCRRPFGSAGFHLEEGMPYCEEHWNELFTSKCEACMKPIQAGHRWLEALNVNWHAECFKCATCLKRLEGETFFSKAGKPYCREHHHQIRAH